MTERELFYRFAAALAIGMLVGLERERAQERQKSFAGLRTFALISVLGSLAAMIADILNSPLAFLAVLLPLGALVTMAYHVGSRRGGPGMTTEVSALVTAGVGVLCYEGYVALAAALGVATTLLLSLKLEMHAFARRITREDIYATLKFAVITAIILPVLPNKPLGPPPLDALNPYKIWLMVIFISGISFFGYVLIKVIGPCLGIGLTGLLGGLTSSTAVTLSFTQRSKGQEELGKSLGLAIMVSWAVMFVRVLVQVGVLNASLLRELWLPVVLLAAVGLAYCGVLYLSQRRAEGQDVDFANPFELWPAIRFGLLYAAISLIARTAQLWLGDAGTYISSLFAGFADVNAITLSMAELSKVPGGLSLDTAARAIILATTSNTVSKGAIVLAAGSPTLRRALLPGWLLVLAVGIALVLML